MQPLKDQKDPFGKLRLDPDSVIAHRESPFALYLLRRDVHPWGFRAVEFEGVPHQVLKHLP
jgi:hypothetical protein